MCGSSPACRITDPTGGYKCFSRRALQAIKLDEINSNGYSFQIEMTHKLWRQGMRIVEVPIIFTERVQGHSKMSGHIIREALHHGLAALVPEQAAPPSRKTAIEAAAPECAGLEPGRSCPLPWKPARAN